MRLSFCRRLCFGAGELFEKPCGAVAGVIEANSAHGAKEYAGPKLQSHSGKLCVDPICIIVIVNYLNQKDMI